VLPLLREYRVLRLKNGDLEVEFAPHAEAALPKATAIPPPTIEMNKTESEACDCGHDVDSHMDAGCMNAACDPAVCEAWAKAQAEKEATSLSVAAEVAWS